MERVMAYSSEYGEYDCDLSVDSRVPLELASVPNLGAGAG